ncbi:folate-binding protein [Glaciimonas sp. Gout2]|uniref:CAF17-like 4Fe-4S cluster assembly/insertion protein YgfZ n=1 Tax=unclassified Glaciimonas TaxID=2644401 RepID=UPI002B237C3F|nr:MULTISPECIES: folate-binding protein [unclassified Glaciimonas]MEB0010003.1 folate-binding protein [Glaciimonas sp. Cout2]MEB0081882.1 folate-binding protein [Glaciimonas sp. Gout2]
MTKIVTTWQEFLNQQSTNNLQTMPDAEGNFVTPITDLGLIALTGDEAANFLHNQLTNDVAQLPLDQIRLAGYCSPKGRLLATLLMWKSDQTIFLQLPRTIQAAVQKRLQMFVMRSKAKLADVTEEYAVIGLGGTAVGAALAPWFTDLPTAPYAKIDNANGTLIRCSDANDVARYQWIASQQIAIAAWTPLSETLPVVDDRVWRLGQIQAGIPQITLATQEQFVPQMINYEVVGGVNFKKGCYPGQEIVARSQYLGKLKRRAVLANVDAIDVDAGTEVFSSADPLQPCGMIVNAERLDPNGKTTTCLLEIKLAALDNGSVHIGSASGPQLSFIPLPYAMPDPVAPAVKLS